MTYANGQEFISNAPIFEEEALTAVFDQFAPAIYKYTLRLCRDPSQADNITGDVFARLIEKLADAKGPATNLRSYLYQTAYHLVIDQQEAAMRITTFESPEGAVLCETTMPVEQQVEHNLEMVSLIEIMEERLTDDQRHVLILRFLEDFSLRETAEIIGKEVNNIKVLQNRAIRKLQKVLGVSEVPVAQ